MTIHEFVSKYDGKFVDYDKVYGPQCVDIVKQWIADNGWPMKSGNAIDWKNNGDAFYKWIPNTVSAVPSPGDIVVFQVGTYGHIGIIVSANQYTCDVFNQNWPHGNTTDRCVVTRFNYTTPKILGWLHPKALDVVPPTPAPPEDPNLARIRALEAEIQTKAQEITKLLTELNTCKANLTLNEKAVKDWKDKFTALETKYDTYREDSADEISRLTLSLTKKEDELIRLKAEIAKELTWTDIFNLIIEKVRKK